MSRALRVGFVIYILAVVVVSLLPGSKLPSPGLVDKIGHLFAYAIMAYWGLYLFRSRRGAIGLLLFTLALGAGMEYLQFGAAGRDPSLADEVANVVGVVLGATLFALRYGIEEN